MSKRTSDAQADELRVVPLPKCLSKEAVLLVFRLQVKMLIRGSKTAAEKVVRESESSDMGSPDKREAIPPVTDVEVCA